MKKYLPLLALLFQSSLSAQTSVADSLVLNNKEAINFIGETYHFFSKPTESLLGWGLISLLVAWIILWLWKKFPDWLTRQLKSTAEKFDGITRLKAEKRILVISSKDGNRANEKFVRQFFETQKFNDKNVRFEQVDGFQPFENFDYDLVFANNEDGELKPETIRKYVRDYSLLFYFGSVRFEDSPDKTEADFIKERYNFANSRAQIFGNLISSLEYHKSIKPDYVLTKLGR